MPNRALTVFLTLTLAIIICWLLNILRFFFLPLVIAFILSFLLYPLVAWLATKKVPLVLAASLTILLSVLVIYLMGTVVLNSLFSFKDEFPRYEAKIGEKAAKVEKLIRPHVGEIDRDSLGKVLGRLSISSIVGSTLSSAVNLIGYLFFTFVFLVYLVLGRSRLPDKVRRAFTQNQAEDINAAMENISRQVQRYMWAKTLTSLITGGLMVIICLIFRVDFPITWGFFTFLLNFIPSIGIILAALMPTLVAFVQYGWVTALWFLVIVSGVMLFLGNVLEPKILGSSVNLSPLVALFALIFWGWLWGAAGMIVAVPLTAVIKFTCDQIEGLRPFGVMMGGER